MQANSGVKVGLCEMLMEAAANNSIALLSGGRRWQAQSKQMAYSKYTSIITKGVKQQQFQAGWLILQCF